MKNTFELEHVGINTDNAGEAEQLALLLCKLSLLCALILVSYVSAAPVLCESTVLLPLTLCKMYFHLLYSLLCPQALANDGER